MSIEDPNKLLRPVFKEEGFIKEQNLRVIRPPERFEMPDNVNFQAFEEIGIDKDNARNLVNKIIEFINMPIIIDQFKKYDHWSRREWRLQVLDHYGEEAVEFLEANKLRKNSFTFINYFWARLEIYHKKNQLTPLSEKIRLIREKVLYSC